MSEALVSPGDRLASTAECQGGHGTYTKDKIVFASLIGRRSVTPSAASGSTLPVISIAKAGSLPLVPKKGNIVLAKVTKITPRLVGTDILCVGTKPLPSDKFTGIVRLEDIRATEVDKIQIGSCYRPGDIIQAEVVSLGTSRDYYLSTAKNHLGVIYAKSLAGEPMIAISWQDMQCPKTKAIEKRKVAKVTV